MKSVNVTAFLTQKAAALGVPIEGTFELTPLCNFDCKMCYVHNTQEEINKSQRKPLSTEKWLSIAKEAHSKGMLYLLLTGGEPLLHKDFSYLYEELIKMGFIISINTNGSLINDKILELFKKYPPRQINITLYGCDDYTYEKQCGKKGMFSIVDKNINALQKNKINLKLNCTATKQNADDIQNIITYAKDNNIPIQTATYVFPPIRSSNDINSRLSPEKAAYARLHTMQMQADEIIFRKTLEQICDGYIPAKNSIISKSTQSGNNSTQKPDFSNTTEKGKLRCRAGRSSFWISWDGYMTACGMFTEPKEDITNNSFESCWDTINNFGKALTLSQQCAECGLRLICQPCTAISKAETGNTELVPPYLCKLTEEIKKLSAEYLTKTKLGGNNND